MESLNKTKQWCRILVLLDAMEQAGIAPVESRRLHGFAYLADVLSPVWGLKPYDGKILKIKDGPHYAELQRELDQLVILGLVDVTDLEYVNRGRSGARIQGKYCLNFDSQDLWSILDALGATDSVDVLDARDPKHHKYLVELACALTTLPNDQLDLAAQEDVTYSDEIIGYENVIEFSEYTSDTEARNRSHELTIRFDDFVPNNTNLSPGEKVYLYASFLGKKISNG